MTKKRSINLIIFLSIILIIGILASFVSFTYPFAINGNYYHYSSFLNEIVLGSDISDGVLITYKADLPDGESECNYDKYLNNTIIALEDILSKSNYKDNDVAKLGDDEIRVVVGDVDTDADRSEVINLIGNPKSLKFSSSSDGATTAAGDFFGRKYVKSVEVLSQDTGAGVVYYVDIKMNSDGTDKLEALTTTISSSAGSLYMYLGETAICTISISDASAIITDGHLQLYSNDNRFIDKNTTQQYANSIKTGLLDLELLQIESSNYLTATLGQKITMYLIVGFSILLLISFVYFVVKYRTLGLMAIFNMLFYIVIGLGLLQSIPFVHVNMSGVLGLGLCYVLGLDAIVTICEKAKAEYNTGKKLHTCFKLAQRKSLFKILIGNLFVFFAGVVCALMPNMAIQSFGTVALVLSLTNIFTSLVLFRVMLKLYTGLNAFKGEKCNFKLEGGSKNVK